MHAERDEPRIRSTAALARALAGFAVLVVLAIASYCWLSAEGRVTANAVEYQRAGAGTPEAATTATLRTDEEAAERSEATEEMAETSAETDPRFDRRGTFVVVDWNGVEYAAEDGTLEVLVDRSPSAIEVKAGAWTDHDFALRDHLQVEGARLGGKPVICAFDADLDPSNPPIHLRGRWLAPVRLLVVGSDTGAPLTDVRVVPKVWSWTEGNRRWGHPGEDDATDPSVVAGVPVLVWPEPGEVRGYFVGAPGYAWAKIDLDPEQPAERWVRLHPCGAVEVQIVGEWPYGATIRLSRHEDDRPFAEWTPEKTGMTRLDSLPIGVWHVAVAKGLWFQQPLVLGRARVEVMPQRVTATAISLRDHVEPASNYLSGTLVYPRAWRRPPKLLLEPTGATKPWGERQSASAKRVAEGSDEYRWNAGLERAGTYQVVVEGSGYRTRFELPPAGDTNVRIVVPEPCDFRLRVLDAETGKVLAPGSQWRGPIFEVECREWEGSSGAELFELQPDGSYVAQAPAGPIRIRVFFDGYESSHTRHEVVPGANDFVVSVRREYGVSITLKDGDATVPWPQDLVASLSDSNGRPVNLYRSYEDARVASKACGELTLAVPSVPGFEPIPPRRVNVSYGTWTDVVIALQRRR